MYVTWPQLLFSVHKRAHFFTAQNAARAGRSLTLQLAVFAMSLVLKSFLSAPKPPTSSSQGSLNVVFSSSSRRKMGTFNLFNFLYCVWFGLLQEGPGHSSLRAFQRQTLKAVLPQTLKAVPPSVSVLPTQQQCQRTLCRHTPAFYF